MPRTDPPAFLIRGDAVRDDPALQPGARGARKLLVTEVYAGKERPAEGVSWAPPAPGEPCAVTPTEDLELAVFTEETAQDVRRQLEERRGTAAQA